MRRFHGCQSPSRDHCCCHLVVVVDLAIAYRTKSEEMKRNECRICGGAVEQNPGNSILPFFFCIFGKELIIVIYVSLWVLWIHATINNSSFIDVKTDVKLAGKTRPGNCCPSWFWHVQQKELKSRSWRNCSLLRPWQRPWTAPVDIFVLTWLTGTHTGGFHVGAWLVVAPHSALCAQGDSWSVQQSGS